jgi:hypothetical protein
MASWFAVDPPRLSWVITILVWMIFDSNSVFTLQVAPNYRACWKGSSTIGFWADAPGMISH